ncbi:hypothetical protein DSO57_1010955 [Entomophthora muscae]|uniref:Uncharacterized protein n=1 Tax=Entomophthora muscae TaxID=34485 RepID=A0ACC2THV0_9FUNG|nr:hypothetical protein DSO57_1010955 [Entomophthora muscae]
MVEDSILLMFSKPLHQFTPVSIHYPDLITHLMSILDEDEDLLVATEPMRVQYLELGKTTVQ